MNINSEIYRLSGDMLAVNNQLEESAGELTPEIAQNLEAIARKEGGLIDQVSVLIRMQDEEHEAIRAEVKRLQDLDKSRQKKIDTIKRWLAFYMQNNDITEIRGAFGEVKLTKGRESVVLDEQSANVHHEELLREIQRLLPSYMKAKVEYSKTELKNEMDRGTSFPFAYKVTTPQLRIK